MKLSLDVFDYPILSLAIDEYEIVKDKMITCLIEKDTIDILNLSSDDEKFLLQLYQDFLLRKNIAKDSKRLKELIVQRALFDIV